MEESGVDTGSAFGFLPISFVSIALLMMAVGMLTMPSSVTSRASVEPRPIAPRPYVQSFLAIEAAAQTTAPAPTPAPAQTSRYFCSMNLRIVCRDNKLHSQSKSTTNQELLQLVITAAIH